MQFYVPQLPSPPLFAQGSSIRQEQVAIKNLVQAIHKSQIKAHIKIALLISLFYPPCNNFRSKEKSNSFKIIVLKRLDILEFLASKIVHTLSLPLSILKSSYWSVCLSVRLSVRTLLTLFKLIIILYKLVGSIFIMSVMI